MNTLRKLLREHDIKQTELADALGVSHWAVIKKLNGQRRWSVDEVKLIAGYLAGRGVNVSVSDVVDMCGSDADDEEVAS